ncbi:hypothetical protein ACFLVM_00970 [Chloroflexota bacterium]
MNTKLGGKNGQRGQALILVLIALAVGSLLVTPTLNYVSAGLLDIRVSKERLLEHYTADAAVEYTMWQLQYNIDGLTDQLDPENPSSSTSITVNGIEVPIITEITQSPIGDTWPFPVPSSTQGVHLSTALVIEAPIFPGGATHFVHKVYMYNSGTSEVHLKAIFQRLDPRLTYVAESYGGHSADLTETYVDDHWELNFDLSEPLPKLGEQEATFIIFTASTDEYIEGDTYSGSGYVTYAGFQSEEGEMFEGEYTPTNIGECYDITVTSGSYTILVNVGITEEGEIIIQSYTIQ